MTKSDLQKTFEDAEAKAQALMAEKDEAIQKVQAKYVDKLRAANDDAATAQKEWLDSEAANALLDRPDGEAVAEALGLELPSK